MRKTLAALALAAVTLTASAQDKPKHHHISKKVWAVVAGAAAAGTVAYVETRQGDHRKMFRLKVPFPPARSGGGK